MGTAKDYQTAFNAAEAWLQKYAAMYANMVPATYVQAITKSVVDAVDAERNPAPAKPKAELHAPEGEPMKGSMLVEMALSMIPWDNFADKDAMRAEIPDATAMVSLLTDNKAAILEFVQKWQKVGPPVKAALKAITKMELGK